MIKCECGYEFSVPLEKLCPECGVSYIHAIFVEQSGTPLKDFYVWRPDEVPTKSLLFEICDNNPNLQAVLIGRVIGSRTKTEAVELLTSILDQCDQSSAHGRHFTMRIKPKGIEIREDGEEGVTFLSYVEAKAIIKKYINIFIPSRFEVESRNSAWNNGKNMSSGREARWLRWQKSVINFPQDERRAGKCGSKFSVAISPLLKKSN